MIIKICKFCGDGRNEYDKYYNLYLLYAFVVVHFYAHYRMNMKSETSGR